MVCRVYYSNPEGRRTHRDVASERGQAEAVFLHHYPGCKVSSVEVLGQHLRSAAPAPVVTLGPDDRPMTERDWQEGLAALQRLKAEIRARPAPVSRPGVVPPQSMEARHRAGHQR